MAKSRSIGGIYAELSLRDGKFKAGMKSASASLKKFASVSAKFAAAGGAATAAALTAGTLRTFDQVDALADLSAQTGVAIGDMMKLQQAYKMGGRSAEMAGKDIGKMQKSIVTATSGGDDPFAAIGLSAQELLAMNPAQQFEKIGAAIMRISNPAERTAKAMEIFGKAGMGLTTVFEGIPDAVTALGKMPEIAEEFGLRMAEANDLIGNLPLKSDQFFMGFAAGIVDTILPGLNDINEYDFTILGMNLAKALTGTLSVFAATFNATWDEITAAIEGRDGAGIQNGIQKYLDAQFANDVDDTFNAAIKNQAKKAPKADALKDIFSPSPEKTKAAAPPLQAARQANEYQRRGLSLDGNNPKIDKQTDILSDIRGFLKTMAESNGQLVW